MTNLFCAKRVLCVSALLLGVLTGIPASAAKIEAATAQRLAEKVAAGEPVRLIVKLKGEGVPPTAGRSARSMIKSAIASRQLSLAARHPGLSGTLKRYRHVPFVAVEADALGLTSILNDDEVESIEEDLPLYLNLTQTAAITKSDLAWSSGYRGAGQTIAILDTGVDSAHPFLSGKVVNEACFSAGGANSTSLCPNGADRQTGPGSARPCSDSTLSCYHGTHVAGIAAGKAGVLSNAAGMAPDAKIIAIQVFTRDCEPGGSCSLSAYTSDLGLALDYVYQLRSTYAISSINMSLGGGLYSANCDSQSPSLKTLIDTLRAANIATVVAAGNNGSTDSISLPACISSAISVGATTKSNVVADYSNSSGLVSLLAPGSAIYSSLPGGGYGTASGTSMAAPHVAGIWALMKAAKPTASVSEILAPLQSSGLAITDNRNGIVKPLIQLGGSGGAIASLAGVSNSPPVVSLSSPAAGASFSAPANITVSASASDADGSVAKVEFYHGSALIATDTNASDGWGVTWSAVPAGSYALSAKAFDNAGSSATSTIANVVVSSPSGGINRALGRPSTASSQWADGCAASYANDGSDNASGSCGGWSPSGSDGQPWWQVDLGQAYVVSTLELVTRQNCCDAPETRQSFEIRASNDPGFASYTVLGNQGTTPLPFKATWVKGVTDANGYRYIRAVKTGYFFMAELRVFGNAAANQPPRVSLTSPTAGASFSAPANITVSASASDADGSVAKVEFYHGSTLIATDTNASDGWRISWNGVAQGSYGLSAKAFDNAGAAAASASVSITVLNSGAAPTLGLLAHYRFDEASGSTASDASGNNNHASLSNGPSWIAGRVQGALSFDGINDGLSLSRLAGLSNGNTPHTIAAWIRINSLPSNRAWLLLLGDQGEGAHHWLVNSSGISQLGSWSGNQAQPTLPTGVWKHLALTFDGTTLKAYLDGSMIATTGASFNLSGSPLTAASQHIGENFFHGALDELRIYNRALTASEVAALAGP